MNPENVRKQGWDVDKLNEEAVNEQPDEILRKTVRGNENSGDADDRDIVGGTNRNETPQGREEAKHQARSETEKNG